MKRTIITTLQVIVTVGLLWLVFHDAEKRAQMLEALRRAKLSWFAAGIGAYFIVELLGSLRWRILLRVQGIRLTFRRIFALFMIGVFFNLFLPGSVGGDIVKIYYLIRETGSYRKAAAMLTVLMDRLIGLIALIAISTVVIVTQYPLLLSTPQTSALLYTLIAILASAILGISFSFVITGFGLVHKLPPRFPGHEKLVELSVAYNLYGRAWTASLGGFAISVIAHLILFYTFYCAARAFTDAMSFKDITTVMPIISTITSMPISVAGVGVREKLFEDLLHALYAVPKNIGVLTSLVGFMITVVWGAVGGFIYLGYRPSDHAKLREIREEVSELEHEIERENG
jgi:uncharacterized protein (TIRG00374 family)